MTAKERLHAVIDAVGEDDLEILDSMVSKFLASKPSPPNSGILAKLSRIKIDAPADFAANLDLYASGERRVEDPLP